MKDVQYFFGELRFELMRWKFLSSTNNCRLSIVMLYNILKIQHRTVYTLESQYGDILSINKFNNNNNNNTQLII